MDEGRKAVYISDVASSGCLSHINLDLGLAVVTGFTAVYGSRQGVVPGGAATGPQP
jgi:hypothetical protein